MKREWVRHSNLHFCFFFASIFIYIFKCNKTWRGYDKRMPNHLILHSVQRAHPQKRNFSESIQRFFFFQYLNSQRHTTQFALKIQNQDWDFEKEFKFILYECTKLEEVLRCYFGIYISICFLLFIQLEEIDIRMNVAE